MAFSGKIEHFSFDLDGTLIDSLPLMSLAWNRVCKEFNLSIGFQLFKREIGRPMPDILRRLNIEDPNNEIATRYFSLTKEKSGDIELFKGAAKLIRVLGEAGKSVSIITSKPRRNAELLLLNSGINVDCLVCGDDLERGKPSPEAFEIVKRNIAINAEETVYFGDMMVDALFAKNADIAFAFVNIGNKKFNWPRTVYPYPVFEVSCWERFLRQLVVNEAV